MTFALRAGASLLTACGGGASSSSHATGRVNLSGHRNEKSVAFLQPFWRELFAFSLRDVNFMGER